MKSYHPARRASGPRPRCLSRSIHFLLVGGMVAMPTLALAQDAPKFSSTTSTFAAILENAEAKAALDKVLAKYPDMVLFHGGNPTGGEHIASLWARARKITQVPFRPDWERFKKAAPFRRNDQMLEVLPKAVVACPGNGINANLVESTTGGTAGGSIGSSSGSGSGGSSSWASNSAGAFWNR